jgi:hypothetical protein
MFLSFQTMEWPRHKQEHLIMQVQKFGNNNLTIQSAIFGLLDAFFTKWQLLDLHLNQKI